jgi:hypothetical protein
MEEQYSNAYYCPISHEVMTDPVNAPDGRTYERKSIVEWLATNPTSPFTRQPMHVNELVTNYALRADIEAKAKAKVEAKEEDVVMSGHGVGMSVKLEISSKEESVIRIVPPILAARSPARLCCVLDISGSMDQEVARIDESGARKLEGVSRIQLAKAAVNDDRRTGG